MPRKPPWHGRIPVIRRTLKSLDTPVLDRASIETAFGLRRRQALRLLATFGGLQAGKSFLVAREAVIARLEALEAHRPIATEIERRTRVAEALQALTGAARARAVALSSPIEVPATSQAADWPEGITLPRPGELLIRFHSPEQLLGCIFALSEDAARDFGAFIEKLGLQEG